MLSNAGRKADMQLKSIFDESKASSGFLKAILALRGQISRLLNIIWSQIIDIYFFFVTEFLTKDKTFIHWTPYIYIHRHVRWH